jgi:hypothetical protein
VARKNIDEREKYILSNTGKRGEWESSTDTKEETNNTDTKRETNGMKA